MIPDIRGLEAGDRAAIAAVDGGNGWNGEPGLWERYLAEQREGRRVILVAWGPDHPVGYGTLAWISDYGPFRSRGIAEINNLSVAQDSRRQGIATALIGRLEGVARSRGQTRIGLGVGLYGDYGSAQRLYARLGFEPDGEGVTYHGRRVEPGAQVCVDDDLILWLSKTL